MAKVKQVGEFLASKKIKHIVSSVHVDKQKINASIVLKNHKGDDLLFMDELNVANPDVQFDYYRR